MDSPSQLSSLSRGRRITLVLTLSGLWTTAPFATDLYLPALPTVARDLGASTSAVTLTVTTFLIGLAIGHLLTAPFSDSVGRKRPLLIGLVVFTVAALAAALAPSVEVLIAVRFIQGLAGASGMAIANAVVTDVTRGRQAARLLSRMALIGGVAPVVAPFIGAQLLQVMPWRGLFVVLTAIGILLVIGRRLRLAGEPAAREALHRRRRRRLPRDVDAVPRRRLHGLRFHGSFAFMAFFAYLAGSSFVFQDLYGVSPTTFALLFGLNAGGMIVASAANHRLLAAFSARRLLAAGLVVAAVAGVSVLVVLVVGGLGVWALALPLFVMATSLGFVFPDSTALTLSLHPEAAGSASAYYGTLRMGLGALATPFVGLGGAASGVPMGLVIAFSSLAALPLFVFVARRTRDEQVVLDTAEEASADMPVG